MPFNPGGGALSGASDVALINLAGGDALTFTLPDQKWENVPSAVISSSIQSSSYTLVRADAGTVVETNSAASITLTVPNNTSVAYPVGTFIEVMQVGTGTVSVAGAAGVTIHSPASQTTRTQWSSIGLRKRFTNTWILSGDLA